MMQSEPSMPSQIPTDGRVDRAGSLTVDEPDPESHSVRERRGHYAMKDRPCGQTVSLDAEFGEPGPPLLELVELFDPIP